MANNQDVAHAFAYRNSKKGSNFYSESNGEKLFSYNTIIAQWHGQTIIVTRTKHSNSTAKHMSKLWGAIRGTNTVYSYANRNAQSFTERDAVEGYKAEKDSLLYKLGRATKPSQYIEALLATDQLIRDLYSLTMWEGLQSVLFTPAEATSLTGDLAGFLAAKAIADAQRTTDQVRRDNERIAAAAVRNAERLATYFNETLPEWRNGTRYSLFTSGYDDLDRIRIIHKESRQMIQTSQGIEVPSDVAIRFYHKLDRCRQRDFTNCEAMEILGYPVKSITAEKVVIGCHHLTWQELDDTYALLSTDTVVK